MDDIITFYSYKGGTGRSMTLANVAVLLARWGYKVLMIDWDLEAPGLELYFKNYTDIQGIRERQGIVDLLYRLADGTVQATDPIDWEPLVAEMPLRPNGETVHLLSAGQRNPEYFSRVRNLNLPSLYLEREGAVFIENLRTAWKEAYDYVLVDSRAGVTDIEGVCTVQLPDILVMFLTANEQSLNGIIDVNREVKYARQQLPFNRSGLRTVPIPNRLDMSADFSKIQKWLDRFADELADFYDNWLPVQIDRREFIEKTKVPYISDFSFGESLAVLEKGATDSTGIGYACETLAALLANNLESIEQLLMNRQDYVDFASIKVDVLKTAYPLPVELHKRITDFLYSLPAIDDVNFRRKLIFKAELDRQLLRQILLDESTSIFCQSIVFTLVNYGRLENGQYPFVALLKAAKNYVGIEKNDECDALIRELSEREPSVISRLEQAEMPVMLPTELTQDIIKFLHSLPYIYDIEGRRALIYSAALDRELQSQIDYTGSSSQFSQLLVLRLIKYGKLADGRSALEVVLESAKMVVGTDKRAYCDQLIQDIQKFQQADKGIYTSEQPKTLTDHETLRSAYLYHLFNVCSQVSLSGIGESGHNSFKLSSIYIPLLTLTSRTAETHGQVNEQRISAIELLNRHRRIVLLGDVGSGKTSFANFVTMCLAGESLGDKDANLALFTTPLSHEDRETEPAPQLWEHGALLPVRVTLRDFAAQGLPAESQSATAKHLWEFISQELTNATVGEYAPYLRQTLLEQGGMIILDGLDEVPESEDRRSQVTNSIQDFMRSFPKCRMLVTCRTYAYQHQGSRLSGFENAVLSPFTRDQIFRFVEQWYSQIALLRGIQTNDAIGQSELLKHSILTHEQLYSLAQHPLLLTLMTSLHCWRGGSLPEKREQLYAEAVDMLLHWWESSKMIRDEDGQAIIVQPSLSEFLNVGKEHVRHVLNRVAFYAHKTQSDLAGTTDIPEHLLLSELLAVGQNKDLRPGRLIEFLNDRTGLLSARRHGLYTFSHRAFQEYLAACFLTGEPDFPENIADLARKDPNRWREILLLSASIASNVTPMLWGLVEALCYKDWDAEDSTIEDAWGALLAGQVLIEIVPKENLSPLDIPRRHQSKTSRLRQWGDAILKGYTPSGSPFPPKERALAGNILSVLGESRSGVALAADGLPQIFFEEIPAGFFLMGSNPEKDDHASEEEQPLHEVHLKAYGMSPYPVTNSQYQSFVEDDGYGPKWRHCWTDEGWTWKEHENITGPYSFGGEFDVSNHPVVGVSWHEAIAFCNWLTYRWRKSDFLGSDEIVRLPSEAEWEYAARGCDGRLYPWGNEIDAEHANYGETGLGLTSAVGCFFNGKSPYGCEDMTGNVWEWCQDAWHDSYDGAPADGSVWDTDGSFHQVFRGGGWSSSAEDTRVTSRYGGSPHSRLFYLGFRVVRAIS